MTGDRGAHPGNRFRKLFYAAKFAQLLRAYVIRVIEILPTSGYVLPDRLHAAVRCRIDEHVSPCRWNFQVLNPIEAGFGQATVDRFVAKASFWSSESTYADVLQTFQLCHCVRCGLSSRNRI